MVLLMRYRNFGITKIAFLLIQKYYLADEIKENEVGGACGEERREKCTGFWWESPKERDLLEDRDVNGRMGPQWNLGRLTGRMLSGFNWLRIGTGGGLL
jgi:hypothetical protein